MCNSSVRDPNPPGSEFTCRMGIRDTKSGPYLQWFVTVNNHIKFKKPINMCVKKKNFFVLKFNEMFSFCFFKSLSRSWSRMRIILIRIQNTCVLKSIEKGKI